MFTKSSSHEPQNVDLEAVLKDTLSLISYQMALDQVQLDKEIQPGLPKFWGTSSEIREIFMNLILNAIQATPEKGRVRISLRTNLNGERFEFCVEDSGKGIPEDQLSQIFDPFYTTFQEGAGLGLYITERLVFKNGGRIRVESEPSKGSLFIVDLPASSPSKEAVVKPVNEVQNV